MNQPVIRFLDKDYGTYIRAIAALSVMLGHITVVFPWYVQRLFPGELWVGVFFFFSGYGLYLSYEAKSGYLNGFWQKKLKNIYLPFLYAELLATTYYLYKNGLSLEDFIFGALGVKLYNSPAWYVIELLVINVLFYAIKKLNIKNGRNEIFIWISFYLIFLIWGVINDIATCWYISTSAFIMGIIGYQNRESFMSLLKGNISVIICSAFLIIYMYMNWLSNCYGETCLLQIPNNYVITFLEMILVPLFVVGCMSCFQRIKMGGAFLQWIGIISYELYLWHFPIFVILRDNITDKYLLLLLTAIISVTISTLFKCSKLKRIIQ